MKSSNSLPNLRWSRFLASSSMARYVEHRLLRESNAVDTGQHLVLFVAAPIGSGHGSELYRLYQPRIGKVRAAAEVGETAVRIERDGTVLQVADEFRLVLVSLLGEYPHGLRLAHLPAHERLLGTGKLLHLLFDFRQVGLRNGYGRIHVVVETVLDARPNAELDARIEAFERFGQQVRRSVPESGLTFGVFPFVELHGGILIDGHGEVHHLAVHRRRQHLLRQPLAD